ncbi:YafY family transcriptional regulator [Paenibacillus sp. N1-5-1-14]|uniref:helix-turn-helix transcriptional regulator n=1 Tax=Paenibacillus radicibacter TaxID=2972488 RepID=UPI00215998B6|nr:YafY family protein [Paenibacillus radicibacter]MCR8644990.1 YafY family transcriptional regulator [Paenibacillus radicibacter]
MLKSQRLIQLIIIINAKKSFTVQELADEFGLSTRTITRDLQELSELGVPVYSVQGRGGGYRLLQERILPAISFSEHEAVAMFIACQSLQRMGALPFAEEADSALNKFYHYLPADVRDQVDRMKGKVAIWSPKRSNMSSSILRTLLKAVMQQVAVTIKYRSAKGVGSRDIQPIGLYASQGYWYCPSFSFKHEQVRLFRVDRIESAVPNTSIPCRQEVGQWDLWSTPEQSHQSLVTMTVELTAKGAHELESDEYFGSSIVQQEDGRHIASIQVSAANLNFYSNWIWRLGDNARIIEPQKAITYTQQKIESMRVQYSGS